MLKIGIKTNKYQPIKALNNLSVRGRKDSEYLAQNPFPPIKPQKLNIIQKFIKTIKTFYNANKF